MSRADIERGVRAGLDAASKTCGGIFDWKRIRALDPAVIAATVPEPGGPPPGADATPDLDLTIAALRQRTAELERENAIFRDAIEDAVDLVSRWCETHDSDSDSACGRATQRRLSEDIGKATPRLMMERPEGQKFYGLRWKDLQNELAALRQRVTDLEHALDADQEHIAMLEKRNT